MELSSPGPLLPVTPTFSLHWYGLISFMAFFSTLAVAAFFSRRRGISILLCLSCGITAFAGAVVGARLVYLTLSGCPFSSLLVAQSSGFALHGAIAGGCLAAWVFCLQSRAPLLVLADIYAVALPLAQAIMRWGNFFNCEALGRPVTSDFPIRLAVPVDLRPLQYQSFACYQPAFLYESVFDLILFVALIAFFYPRYQQQPGVSFCIYLALYNVGRLCIEPLRIDSLLVAGVPAPIIFSAAFLTASLVGANFLRIKYIHKAAAE